jgi:hypothetical protein
VIRLSDGELMFEERFRNWSLSHPRLWIVTDDRIGAYEFVSSQINKVVKAQLKAADNIVVS